MTTTGSHVEAQITEEAIARLRERIGVPMPDPVQPFLLRPDADSMRHWAYGYGDDNPLWWDEEYAAGTRWGGMIAPPGMLGGDVTTGVNEVQEVAPEHRQLMRGDPLRGVHAFRAGTIREWYAPMRAGQEVFSRNAFVGILKKQSEFGGISVVEHNAHGFRDGDGTLLGSRIRTMIRTERQKAAERGKYKATELQPYTPEELEAIDAQYQAEKPRGAEPRYWEDVNEGDEIGPLVKGPLTVTDIICWHIGCGMGIYGVAPLRMGYKNRQRIPRFYIPTDLNVPDVSQRCHWDDAWAQSVGNPYAYDYGVMRENWLIHLCTDWMGDDAWLWKIDCQMRRFNYLGDTHWMRGKVTKKYVAEGDRPAIDLDLWGENQRGEVTCPATASILLSSRKHGQVRLPDPPGGAHDLPSLMEALIARYED